MPNALAIFNFGGVYYTKFECILKATLMPTNRTRGARGGSKLPRTLVSPRHFLAEPRQPRKKNTPCISSLAGVKFLLKKERVFFFRGSAFQVFRQVAEQCGRSFGKAIFWGKGLPKLRLICFLIRMSQMEKEGFGEEFSICSSFCFGGIQGGHHEYSIL